MKVWTLALAVSLGGLAMPRVLHANPEDSELMRVAEDDSNWEETATQEEPEAPPPEPPAEEEPPPPPPEE